MDELLAQLRAYSRFLELEDSIPYWEAQKPELEERISEMQWNQRQKELELLQLNSPNFFQRVFGKAEEKKEKISQQIRQIASARTAAQWELESLDEKISQGVQALEALAGSKEAYTGAKVSAVLTPAQESRLMMEEISAFVPVALETSWRILEALEDARPWMQQDALSTRDGPENRKMACLNNAEAAAKRLCGILSVLPEGICSIGGYLRAPHAYIYAVTSECKQLDRLDQAQEQIRALRNQLKLVLGE